jgi:TolB-like protein
VFAVFVTENRTTSLCRTAIDGCGSPFTIINALGRVSDLRVSSYTSSVRFKGKALDPQSIGRELVVSWLLEGSVRKSGDMVRIAVQLVRTNDGFSAWSGRFDRRLDDIFSVQDDIAGMIAETLTRRVAQATGPLVTSTTSNAEARCVPLHDFPSLSRPVAGLSNSTR